jgi:hypothetical protein
MFRIGLFEALQYNTCIFIFQFEFLHADFMESTTVEEELLYR